LWPVPCENGPQIRNFGQGSAHDSPKMEASCEFDFWKSGEKFG
jgi:hypothetical protein